MWKDIREDAGLTQTDIGKVFGITRQAVSQFENGLMPEYIQAYYLRLRGLKLDITLAEYFENKYKKKLERLNVAK